MKVDQEIKKARRANAQRQVYQNRNNPRSIHGFRSGSHSPWEDLEETRSEMILKAASKKALNFVQESTVSIEANSNFSRDNLSRVINEIGTTNINIDESVMENVQKSLHDEGYQGAMLYAAQYRYNGTSSFGY